ncbi:MAG: hypothetical protein AAGE52_01520 [Myxococcota bacterium]
MDATRFNAASLAELIYELKREGNEDLVHRVMVASSERFGPDTARRCALRIQLAAEREL